MQLKMIHVCCGLFLITITLTMTIFALVMMSIQSNNSHCQNNNCRNSTSNFNNTKFYLRKFTPLLIPILSPVS